MIKESPDGSYYFEVPSKWEGIEKEWKKLAEILKPFLKPDKNIYVDMAGIAHISDQIFNILYEFAILAGKERTKLYFTGVSENMEERMALLSSSME